MSDETIVYVSGWHVTVLPLVVPTDEYADVRLHATHADTDRVIWARSWEDLRTQIEAAKEPACCAQDLYEALQRHLDKG